MKVPLGEIIAKPQPQQALAFNGERMTSDFGGQTAIEHWHRYLLARELVRGCDVLDVACGEGYGSALMMQTARSVVGLDVSATAVAHAQASYTAEGLRYEQASALALPLPDASVDMVVSFETLEHFTEHDVFLREIKRVLRPNGLLLISTPDRDTYSPATAPPNPYHKLELTTAEFLALLQRHFTSVSSQGQRIMLGSALVGTAGGATPFCFERRGEGFFETSPGMARAKYIVALASDQPGRALPDSVYIDTDHLLHFDGRTIEDYIARGITADLPEVLERTRAEMAHLRATLDALYASSSWRLTAPFRRLLKLLRRR